VLGSLFLSTETWGESPAASKKSSEVSMNDAQALMHAVAEKERKNQGQYLRFKASITGPDGDAAPGYEGKLWMGKEGQFRLEYPGGTLVSDGATFSEYHPKNQQVILRHAGEPGNRLLPGQIFTRFLTAQPLEANRQGDIWQIRLNPEPFGNMTGLKVDLDAAKKSVAAVETVDAAGTQVQYRVSERKAELPEGKKFEFTPPAGTEIVDMR
jgi:outer membrane lipoprotein-sorting protein